MNDYFDCGHWIIPDDYVDIPDVFGFVYIIVNRINGKKYIGSKQMVFKKTLPPLKGNKRKRTKLVESDWRTYTGSCNKLNEDIQQHGKENFDFYIIDFCNNKYELKYIEAYNIIFNDAINSEEFYNEYLFLRLRNTKKNKMKIGGQ